MATTLLCPGSPRSGPQLRHEQRPGAPSGCAPALREWLDGVSDALCMLPPQLRDYRPFATTATRSRLPLPGTRSSRQGCNPAGESPAVSVARNGHVAMPLLGAGNQPSSAWCKRPGRPEALSRSGGCNRGV